MLPECRHILPSGHKCTALALRGKYYCYFHTRLHNLAAKPAPPPNEPIRLPVLEDRSAILVALTQIVNALGDSRLDPRRAGLYLYGLQIATQNVERQHDVVPLMASHDVTRSPEGDELGPVISRCEPPEDCPNCDFKLVCQEYNAVPEEDLEDGGEDEEEGKRKKATKKKKKKTRTTAATRTLTSKTPNKEPSPRTKAAPRFHLWGTRPPPPVA